MLHQVTTLFNVTYSLIIIQLLDQGHYVTHLNNFPTTVKSDFVG